MISQNFICFLKFYEFLKWKNQFYFCMLMWQCARVALRHGAMWGLIRGTHSTERGILVLYYYLIFIVLNGHVCIAHYFPECGPCGTKFLYLQMLSGALM